MKQSTWLLLGLGALAWWYYWFNKKRVEVDGTAYARAPEDDGFPPLT